MLELDQWSYLQKNVKPFVIIIHDLSIQKAIDQWIMLHIDTIQRSLFKKLTS